MLVKPIQVITSTLLLSPFIVLAVVMTGANYSIISNDLKSGGGSVSSANYSTHYSLGQIAVGNYLSVSHQINTNVLSATDTDNDLIPDIIDNCQFIININQLNSDTDAFGNACDLDDDNDGLSDAIEMMLGTNPILADTDGDGLNDNVDPNPLTPLVNGDLAPYGAPDGIINAADLLIVQQIVLGIIAPTPEDIIRGDLYPEGSPDGVIDISDLLLLEQLILSPAL